jgi:hypothetical protein
MSTSNEFRTRPARYSDQFRTRPAKYASLASQEAAPITQPKQATQESEGDSWPALLAKSAAKGLTDMAGFFGNFQKSPQATPETQKIIDQYKDRLSSQDRQLLDSRMPTSPEITNYFTDKTGYDFTPRPSNAAQRIAGNAVEFGVGSLIPVTKVQGIAPLMKQAGVGAGIGAASGSAQEMGVNPLVADIGATIATPYGLSALKNTPKALANAPRALMGLSPNKINLEAGLAARDLGIDLPAAVLTDSKLVGLADQLAGKVPFLGTNKIKKKYDKAQEQTVAALDDIYNQIGPQNTPSVEKEIDRLYKSSEQYLPQNASIEPTSTLAAINKIKNKSAVLSPEEKQVFDYIKNLKSELSSQGAIPNSIPDIGYLAGQQIDLSKIKGLNLNKTNIQTAPVDIKTLTDTKRSLNKIIKWNLEDPGVKKLLKSVQAGINKDIQQYGKTNPEFYKVFKEADGLFGKVAKRKETESALGTKATNYATDDLSYNTLAKSIRDPNKAQILEKQTSPEIMDKIEKLGTVAKAMSKRARDIPNPSGTAITHSSLAVIGGLFTKPISTISTLLGGQVASELLTNKKFLDAAIDAANNPKNPIKSMAFNKRLKDITGYSVVDLNRELARQKTKDFEEQYPDAITIDSMGGQ